MNECLLCKRDMSKSDNVFGKGCISNIYKFLNIESVIKFKNKEKFLYKSIMENTNNNGLNKNQKVWLTDRYLTYKYLDTLKYGDFTKLKQSVNNDIQNIKNVSKQSEMKSFKEITLKESYDLYKKENKFQNRIKKLLDTKFDDWDSKTKLILTSFSFIFNMQTNKKQYQKDSSKKMQYAFWQTVAEVGGKYAGFELSAMLLQHSLKEDPKDILITEGKIIDKIKKDVDFINVLNKVIEENKNKQEFNIINVKDGVRFRNSDLYFSIHRSELCVSGNKTNIDSWNLNVTLTDKYDYTDFKEVEDYYFDTQNVLKSLFSSTLYNLAYASVKLGVIKTYNIQIKLKINNYKVG